MRATVAMALVLLALALVGGSRAQYEYGGAAAAEYDGDDYENHLREGFGGVDGRFFEDDRAFDGEGDDDPALERGAGGRELYLDNPYDTDADD